jgi:hypothetical protein
VAEIADRFERGLAVTGGARTSGPDAPAPAGRREHGAACGTPVRR